MFYQIVTTSFSVLVIMTNIISSKMVQIPFLTDFSMPAGFLIYPLTFFLSDLITELFGAKKAQQMVYIAFGMSALSCGILQMAIWLPSAPGFQQEAFRSVLSLSSLILFASLTAYVVSQLADIELYAWIKRITGPRFLWLRNNGSTLIAQLLDTAIVNTIHLHLGLKMGFAEMAPIMLFSYCYKAAFNIALTPLFYALVFFLKERTKRGIWETR